MDQNFASSIADNARKMGQDSVNAFNPTATQQNFLSNYNNLNASQQQGSQGWQDQYSKAIANNPTATSLYAQANDMFNVPGLMQQSTNLNNAMLQTPQMNVNAAKGFNYDANQIGHQTNQDLARLSPLAGAATNQAQQAQTLAGQYVNQGMAQNAINLKPVEAQQQFLLQQQQNQSNAQLAANEQEMAGLTSKMQSGVQLSEAEYSRYNQLVQAQAQLQSAQTAANASQNVAKTQADAQLKAQQLQNQFANLAAGNTLVNTATGGTYRAR